MPAAALGADAAYTSAMSNRLVSVLAVLLATAACGYPKSGAVPGPISPTTEASAATRWPGATPESLASGRALFQDKCDNCHGHPDVKAIAEDKWPGVVKRMGGKAKLTEAQSQDVLHFVLAARSDAPAK